MKHKVIPGSLPLLWLWGGKTAGFQASKSDPLAKRTSYHLGLLKVILLFSSFLRGLLGIIFYFLGFLKQIQDHGLFDRFQVSSPELPVFGREASPAAKLRGQGASGSDGSPEVSRATSP